MLRLLIHNWWLLALRSIFALFFAVIGFSLAGLTSSPLLTAISFATVVAFFGWLAFLTGVLTIAAALRGLDKDRFWWLLMIDGVAACAAGAIALFVPGLILIKLIHTIVAWTILVGACELAMATRLRRHLADEWLLLLAGSGGFAFGIYFIFVDASLPGDALRWLSFYALFSAVTMLALALRLRKLARAMPQFKQSIRTGPQDKRRLA